MGQQSSQYDQAIVCIICFFLYEKLNNAECVTFSHLLLTVSSK